MADPEKNESLLSIDEAARFLGVSKPTLYRLISQSAIRGLKAGQRWRFRQEDLQAYMERGPVAIAAPPVAELLPEVEALRKLLRPSQEAENDDGKIDDMDAEDSERLLVTVAQSIVKLAIQRGASDIHLDPAAYGKNGPKNSGSGRYLWFRIRIDGVLHEIRLLPESLREALTAHFKIVADLNISEKHLPQDGRIPVRYEEKDYDLRVATVPTIYGESIAIRILMPDSMLIVMDKLGLEPKDLSTLREALNRPNGLILGAGPIGSGKTSLLVSCLVEKASPEVKVISVEHPVDFALRGVTQISVEKQSGLGVEAALNAALRLDPDVLMIGEIPDEATARLCVHAALEGHLVLGQMTSEGAPEAISALVNSGVKAHLLAQALLVSIGMRLVRRSCPKCSALISKSDPILQLVPRLLACSNFEAPKDAEFRTVAGCDECGRRGYRGRIALYEVLENSEAVRRAILNGASTEEIQKAAVAEGMMTLTADGVRKAARGLTTLEEVMRVVSA